MRRRSRRCSIALHSGDPADTPVQRFVAGMPGDLHMNCRAFHLVWQNVLNRRVSCGIINS